MITVDGVYSVVDIHESYLVLIILLVVALLTD